VRVAFFGLFGGKKERESVLLIHAGSASVAGGYLVREPGKQPAFCYAARVALEPREGEKPAAVLERALDILCEKLAREGGPELLRAAGSAHASRASAYLSAPWEAAAVRTEEVEYGREFTVSRATRAKALAQHAQQKGSGRSEDSVIATFLNGYETKRPFGKRALRASFVILSSSVDEEAAAATERAVRRTLHLRPAVSAFLPTAYRALRALYPHESDYFLIDASGDATSIALIEQGVLSDARSVPHGTRELAQAALVAGVHAAEPSADAHALIDQSRNQRFGAELERARESWRTGLMDALKSFASSHALPRTLFIVADAEARGFLKSALAGPGFSSLWVADEPPRVIALAPQNAAGVVLADAANADLALMLLALAESAGAASTTGAGEPDAEAKP
jgi:hypothetical protein